MSAPVSYSWKNSDATSHSGWGETRDVSESGVFVVSEVLPPVGALLQFEVLLSFGDNSHVTMKAEGKVLRVSGRIGDAPAGFAAITNKELVLNPAPSRPNKAAYS